MVKRRGFTRGDIVRVNQNPVIGLEVQYDYRNVLVLSPAAYNDLGLAIVVPIAPGGDFARFAGFVVPLAGSGCETQGVVLVNMVREMDLEARHAKRVESAPEYIIQDSLDRLIAILNA